MTESGERTPEIAVEKPQGEIWLELIGYGHRTSEVITKSDGTQISASDFHLVCEEHAGPMFKAIEHLSADSNRDEVMYGKYLAAARKGADAYLGPDPAQET